MRNDVVLGYRNWRVNVSTSGLAGPVSRIEWPDNRALEARCEEVLIHKSSRAHNPEPHASPDQECICGIYAFHTFHAAIHNYNTNSLALVGPALFWGKIEVYTLGFKAQYARPLALCDQKDPQERFHSADGYMDPKQFEWEDVLESVVARYSIPLLPYDLVEQYAATWARPLGAEIDD